MKSGSASAQTHRISPRSKRHVPFALSITLASSFSLLATITTASLTPAHAFDTIQESPLDKSVTATPPKNDSTASLPQSPNKQAERATESPRQIAAASRVQKQKKELDAPRDVNADATDDDSQLTPNAEQLAKMLKIVDTITELKSKSANKIQSRDDIVDIMVLRDKLSRAIQYASLELEEALANIDGELAIANMQYAFFSDKHDRALMMNNIAAFTSSGGLGVLDSSISIRSGPPLPNIFGITGNALAVAIPLLGLRTPKYKVVTQNEHHATKEGNMLAPIFNRTDPGPGYDPIVWTYLQAVPADSKTGLSRIQTLLKSWEKYRKITPKDAKTKPDLDIFTEMAPKDKKVSIAQLKTRSDLLVELRAQVQQMYKDISDLNTSIMAIH